MDVLDLIKRRRSIPRFKPDPVLREVIEKMLEAATWTPNHHLTAPWEFTVLEGAAKARFAEIRRGFRLALFADPAAPEAQKAADKIYHDTVAAPTIVAVTTRVADEPDVGEWLELRLASPSTPCARWRSKSPRRNTRGIQRGHLLFLRAGMQGGI